VTVNRKVYEQLLRAEFLCIDALNEVTGRESERERESKTDCEAKLGLV
jgi:hypothetical protein